MKIPIYLDYAATTPVDARVADRMARYLTIDGEFGNPASINHQFGRTAKGAVEEARGNVAELIGAGPAHVIWTSGATESINLALKATARNLHQKGSHIVTMKTEHKAVLDVCRVLDEEDFRITYLAPTTRGLIDLDLLEAALRPETVLVSVVHVNNETGVTQDLAAIGRLTSQRGIVFHVDAAQSAGKLPIDVDESYIDLMSVCAHKVYGPKGVGALYVRDRSILDRQALIHGGGHEQGLRAGTLPTHQIVGMGEAFRLAADELEKDHHRISGMKHRLWTGLESIGGVWLNGSLENSVAGILNVGFEAVDGEDLLLELPDLALSTGAACSSFMQEPSHVLSAMGLSDESINNSIRFSLGRFTSEQEIDYALASISRSVRLLRAGT